MLAASQSRSSGRRRSIERAENTSRLFDVSFHGLLDARVRDPEEEWRDLLRGDRAGRALPRALLRVHAEGGDRVPALASLQSGQRHGLRRACPREPARRPGADLQRDVGAPEPAPPARGADPPQSGARGAARVPRPRSRRVPRLPGSDEGDALPWRGIRVPRARLAPRACRHDCAGSPDEHAEAGGRIRGPAFVAAEVVRRLRGLPPPRVGGGSGRARRRVPSPRAQLPPFGALLRRAMSRGRPGDLRLFTASASGRSECSSRSSPSQRCRNSIFPH